MRITLQKPHWNNRAPLALILGISAVALFTHVFHLDSLFPVPYFDPAYNGLDALRLLRRNMFPVFFPTNGGREPLLIYLQALSMGLLGVNTFALRLPGALAGALSAPLLFGLGRSIFQDRARQVSLQAALWAALTLSLSTWFISQNRLGLRVALLPPLAIGAMWLFVEGWRRGSCLRLAAAGVLMGLSVYTYTAARFLPFVFVLAALPDLLRSRSGSRFTWRQRWLAMALLAVCAVVVFAPLGAYYLSHLTMFADRAGSVMVWNVWQPGSGTTLAQELLWNVGRSVGWFTQLPLPIFLGLAVGIVLAIARARRIEYRLLLIWWAVLLLPAILTIENPHLMRSLGAAPPTYLFVGLGWAVTSNWLLQSVGRANLRRALSTAVFFLGSLFLSLSSIPALWSYFTSTEEDGLARIEATANAIVDAAKEGAVYLPLDSYDDPSLRFLLAGSFHRRTSWTVPEIDLSGNQPVSLIQPTNFDNPHLLVRFSPDGWTTLLPPVKTQWLASHQDAAISTTPITDRYRNQAGQVLTLPAASDPAHYLMPIDMAAVTNVPGVAQLIGYRADAPAYGPRLPHLTPAGALWITTYWHAHGQTSEDYDLLVYLVDDAGQRWGSADGLPLSGAYSTSLWRPGEQVADSRLMWVYPEAHPGRYWIDVAFYAPTINQRLPVDGTTTNDTIRLGPLKVPLAPSQTPSELIADGARFGDTADLLGYVTTLTSDGLLVELLWQAAAPDGEDYTVFVHLLDASGQVVAGQDSQPVDGQYPTGIWEAGETVADRHSVVIRDLPQGDYELEVGMYTMETGERLPVILPNGSAAPDRTLLLQQEIRIP